MITHALEHFRRPPRMLNCAQSVLYAYQKMHGSGAVTVEEMKAFGGGRAPGGLCGALYAACIVEPAKAELLKERFAAETGSIYCKELKTSHQACAACVTTGARILQEFAPGAAR